MEGDAGNYAMEEGEHPSLKETVAIMCSCDHCDWEKLQVVLFY